RIVRISWEMAEAGLRWQHMNFIATCAPSGPVADHTSPNPPEPSFAIRRCPGIASWPTYNISGASEGEASSAGQGFALLVGGRGEAGWVISFHRRSNFDALLSHPIRCQFESSLPTGQSIVVSLR